MYVEFGKRPFGKCDVVPELFYVATFFFHINRLPLVPLQTYLIMGQTGTQYQAVKIPFSWRSLFYAWARAATFLLGVIFLIVSVAQLSDRRIGADANEWAVPGLIGVFLLLGFVVLMWYPRKRMPSYERAAELARHAGLNEVGWAALNVLYGREIGERPGL